MFLNVFNLLITKIIIFIFLKNIFLIYFFKKNILKINFYHTLKHILNIMSDLNQDL
jgi:hypothetical protein